MTIIKLNEQQTEDGNEMKVTKQSLIDWEVTENGKHVAWITKVGLGYEVTFKGNDFKYFKPNFKEAKQFATM